MVIKVLKSSLITAFAAVLLTQNAYSFSLISASENSGISWDCLNLSYNQKIQMQALDMHWQKTSLWFRNQIISDKNKLKYLLKNPFSTDEQIKRVQDRILTNQNRLRSEAMNNFLKKRSILSISQRKKLHAMF